ncbi:MAG: hypothetical protein GXP42_17335 [Chloroflexi bacterium]|nr:hypothetical protein [Chloroflexota bacterium]
MIPWKLEFDGDQAKVHLEVRSTAPWLVEHYLVKLGGTVVEKERLVVGPEWEARIERGEPVALGSLRIGVTFLDLIGSETALRELMKSLEIWLMRGGG